MIIICASPSVRHIDCQPSVSLVHSRQTTTETPTLYLYLYLYLSTSMKRTITVHVLPATKTGRCEIPAMRRYRNHSGEPHMVFSLPSLVSSSCLAAKALLLCPRSSSQTTLIHP
uniref:Uncharacterized protein n=1 Tax=Vitrella brassicaformis TaxID=1169539 RepID=A0A7S1P6A0_9ALVE